VCCCCSDDSGEGITGLNRQGTIHKGRSFSAEDVKKMLHADDLLECGRKR